MNLNIKKNRDFRMTNFGISHISRKKLREFVSLLSPLLRGHLTVWTVFIMGRLAERVAGSIYLGRPNRQTDLPKYTDGRVYSSLGFKVLFLTCKRKLWLGNYALCSS